MEKLLLTLMALFCLTFTVVAEDDELKLLYTYTPDETVYIYGGMNFQNIITDEILREITIDGDLSKTAMDAVVGTQYLKITFGANTDPWPSWVEQGSDKENYDAFLYDYPYSIVDFTDGKRTVSCGSSDSSEGSDIYDGNHLYTTIDNTVTLKLFIYGADEDEDSFYVQGAFHGWDEYTEGVGKLKYIEFYGDNTNVPERPMYTYIPEDDITIVGSKLDKDDGGNYGNSGATEEDYESVYHTLISSEMLGNKMKHIISTKTVSITFTSDDDVEAGHGSLAWSIPDGTLHLKVISDENQEHHIFEFGKGAVVEDPSDPNSDYEGDNTELGGQSSTVEVPINITDIESFTIEAAFTGWEVGETIAHVECVDFFGEYNYKTPDDFEYNGVWYHITDDDEDGEVEVTYPKDDDGTPYSGEIVIPTEAVYKDILTYKVTSMGTGAFVDNTLTSVEVESSEPINSTTASDDLSKVFAGIDKKVKEVLLIVPDAKDKEYNESSPTTDQQAYVDAGWLDYFVFKYTEGLSDGIEAISEDVEIIAIYNVVGQQINEPQRGMNIIKYSDGTVKKVLVK